MRKITIQAAASMILIFMLAVPLHASDVRLDGYKNPPNENLRIFNELYLDGVKSGLFAYSALLKSKGAPPAFCPPSDILITSKLAEDIMLTSASRRSAKGDTPVASLLLWGLRDTYPCPNI